MADFVSKNRVQQNLRRMIGEWCNLHCQGFELNFFQKFGNFSVAPLNKHHLRDNRPDAFTYALQESGIIMLSIEFNIVRLKISGDSVISFDPTGIRMSYSVDKLLEQTRILLRNSNADIK
ncbi:hypothetical protein PENTCL1PPCAC_12561 [Pristionchus entomophagus]|uniref:Uncharacterized protein n=1 Tax=Pristionchus entomophagus TaxID=358040 RepID=A0AAV5T468_9BILA|nr:hypothetical protein PENTCL1PPCAC_12561 [Pristionchus entomophagus]